MGKQKTTNSEQIVPPGLEAAGATDLAAAYTADRSEVVEKLATLVNGLKAGLEDIKAKFSQVSSGCEHVRILLDGEHFVPAKAVFPLTAGAVLELGTSVDQALAVLSEAMARTPAQLVAFGGNKPAPPAKQPARPQRPRASEPAPAPQPQGAMPNPPVPPPDGEPEWGNPEEGTEYVHSGPAPQARFQEPAEQGDPLL